MDHNLHLVEEGSGAPPPPDDDDLNSGLPEGLASANAAEDGDDESTEKLSFAELRELKECSVRWGKKEEVEKVVKWTIHADQDRPSLGPTPLPSSIEAELREDIDWTRPPHELFFDYVFPSLKGHATFLDKWASDPRCSWHNTYRTQKMKFVQDGDDPDALIKQMYLVLIAGTTEVECGVESLFKSGGGDGRKMYPDFGRYVLQNMFNVRLDKLCTHSHTHTSYPVRLASALSICSSYFERCSRTSTATCER